MSCFAKNIKKCRLLASVSNEREQHQIVYRAYKLGILILDEAESLAKSSTSMTIKYYARQVATNLKTDVMAKEWNAVC